jgi:hypothetical protein
MINKKFKLFNIFLILILLFTNAKIAFANERKQISSTWIWQANSPTRTIYLLGEMHYFYVFDKEIKITHDLAEHIYELSDKIFIENMQASAENYNLHFYISEALKNKMHNIIARIINKISNQSDIEKSKLINEFYLKFSESDPFFVYNELLNLNTLKHIFNTNFSHTTSEGFLQTLRDRKKSFLYRFSSEKIEEIESHKSLSVSWKKYCNTSENAEILINSALDTVLNEANYFDNFSYRQQKIFIDFNSNIDDIMNTFTQISEGKIIIKCAAYPRNKMWIDTIQNEIKKPGPPISIVAGIAHMGGENGLIELLRKEGFSEIKRIYEIK